MTSSTLSFAQKRDRLIAQAFLLVGEIYAAPGTSRSGRLSAPCRHWKKVRPLRAAWGLGRGGCFSTWPLMSVVLGVASSHSVTRSAPADEPPEEHLETRRSTA